MLGTREQGLLSVGPNYISVSALLLRWHFDSHGHESLSSVEFVRLVEKCHFQVLMKVPNNRYLWEHQLDAVELLLLVRYAQVAPLQGMHGEVGGFWACHQHFRQINLLGFD